MKRNESILVYSVTGLLVVILAVAILFGNERGAQAKGQSQSHALDDLTDPVVSAPGSDSGEASTENAPTNGASELLADAGQGSGPEGTPAKAPPAGGVDPAADAGEQPPASVPLRTSPPSSDPSTDPAIGPPSPAADDPATQALVLLGDSKRDGDYRIVTVRHNDTFSELVQRWCGSLDQLEVAESLNEEVDLARLAPGSRVCLPWVDDAELVAAHLARKSKQETATKTIAQARAQGQDYVVKPGDSLWGIAVRQVGAKRAPKFVDEIKALNPELLANPNSVQAGKTIVLPK